LSNYLPEISTVVGTRTSRSPFRLVLHLNLSVNPREVPVHLQHPFQLFQFTLFLLDLGVCLVLLDLGQQGSSSV
jgi:hypothetical protein